MEGSINTVAIPRMSMLFLIEVMKNDFIKVVSFGIELEVCAVFQKLVLGLYGAHSGRGSVSIKAMENCKLMVYSGNGELRG